MVGIALASNTIMALSITSMPATSSPDARAASTTFRIDATEGDFIFALLICFMVGKSLIADLKK